MDRLFQDLRFALRLLWKDRGFSATVLSTLALCIAANTAIFAVINSVLLRPLPFEEPDRLAIIYNSYPGAGAIKAANGVPDYYDRLAQVKAFDEIAMYRTQGVTLGGQGLGGVERITTMPVTPSFFRILRVPAYRGQLFTEKEAEPGQDKKVILSYALWQRLYGGRDDAVGKEMRLNGVLYSVVGVMPRSFQFVDPDVVLWSAAAFTMEERGDDRRHSNSWQQIGRLAPGRTLEQAQSQIDAVNKANFDRFPQLQAVITNVGFHTVTRSFQGRARRGLAAHAVSALGRRPVRADYRLRQHREPRVHPRQLPRPRAGDAACARREHRAAVAANPHRNPPHRQRRWRIGDGLGLVGVERRHGRRSRPVAARVRDCDELAVSRVHDGPGAGRRHARRRAPGARAAARQPRPDRPRGRPLGDGVAPHPAGAPCAGHEPGGVRIDPAGRGGPPAGQLPASPRDRPGLRRHAGAHREHQPAVGALRR